MYVRDTQRQLFAVQYSKIPWSKMKFFGKCAKTYENQKPVFLFVKVLLIDGTFCGGMFCM